MDDRHTGHALVIRLSGILGVWRLWTGDASNTRQRGRTQGSNLSRCRI